MSDRSKPPNGKKEFKQLEILLIRRVRVKQSLVMVSVLALLISSCGANYNQPRTSTRSNSFTTNREKLEAVFYENVAQCETDTKKKWTEYQANLAAYEKKQITVAPEEPGLKSLHYIVVSTIQYFPKKLNFCMVVFLLSSLLGFLWKIKKQQLKLQNLQEKL